MRKAKAKLTPAQVVKELRIKKGWTQGVLSEITSIAVANISNIERGRSRLGEDRAIILAKALGVNPQFILFPNGFERNDLKAKLQMVTRKLNQLKEAA